MEKLKLISVKIDPETLRALDKFQERHYYWKRNTIINGILSAVVECFDNDAIYDMVRFSRYYNPNASGTFKLEKVLPTAAAANERSE